MHQQLDYQEQSLYFTLNQLIADEWSVGMHYRLTEAELSDEFPELPEVPVEPGTIQRDGHVEGTLHEVELHTLFNHPSGFFAAFEALWQAQSNRGYHPDRPGDDFWQFNVFAGYRWAPRKAELTLGILNLTDQDYRLNPLTLYQDRPRERTFMVRLRFGL